MRHISKAEVATLYNCDRFPLSAMIQGDDIDIYRILMLDYDIPVSPLPSKLDVFLSVILHHTDYQAIKELIVSLITLEGFHTDNEETYTNTVSLIEGYSRNNLASYFSGMYKLNKDWTLNLIDLFTEEIKNK